MTKARLFGGYASYHNDPRNRACHALRIIFQFVGHRLEGPKPKFLENLIDLVIGPLHMFEEGVDELTRCL